MEPNPQISVVVPVFNNANTLRELTERIAKHLNDYHFEIIYINDASQDQSPQIIQSISDAYHQVRSKSLLRNQGQQKAILEGLKLAQGNRVVVLDADLQDVPERILGLYALLENHTGACFIKRIGNYQRTTRMITSRVLKRMIQWKTKLHYRAGSYYMVDQVTLKKILEVAPAVKYPYLSIMVAVFASEITYLEARRAKTNEASSYTFKKRLKYAYRAFHCANVCKKLKKQHS